MRQQTLFVIFASGLLSGLLAVEPVRRWVRELPGRLVRALILFVKVLFVPEPRPPKK